MKHFCLSYHKATNMKWQKLAKTTGDFICMPRESGKCFCLAHCTPSLPAVTSVAFWE